MIGFEGPTRMDKNGHVSIQEEALGDFVYKSRFCGTHQACPHSGWTWKLHMGSTNSKNRGLPDSNHLYACTNRVIDESANGN